MTTTVWGKINFIKEITCPELSFVDTIRPAIALNEGKLKLPATTHTAKEKADEWLSNQSSILHGIINDPKRELNCIVDWDIVGIKNIEADGSELIVFKEKKEKKRDLVTIMKEDFNTVDEKFLADFAHTYEKMKESISGLSNEKKLSIVLSSMSVGMQASSNAYSRMTAILNGQDPDIINNEKLLA